TVVRFKLSCEKYLFHNLCAVHHTSAAGTQTVGFAIGAAQILTDHAGVFLLKTLCHLLAQIEGCKLGSRCLHIGVRIFQSGQHHHCTDAAAGLKHSCDSQSISLCCTKFQSLIHAQLVAVGADDCLTAVVAVFVLLCSFPNSAFF